MSMSFFLSPRTGTCTSTFLPFFCRSHDWIIWLSSISCGSRYLLRNVVGVLVILLDELLNNVVLAALFGSFDKKMVLPDEFAAPNKEHLHTRAVQPRVVLHDRDNVLVYGFRGHHALAFQGILDGLQTIPQPRRPLEFQILGGFFHLLAHILDDTLFAPVQKVGHVLAGGAVLFFVGESGARERGIVPCGDTGTAFARDGHRNSCRMR